MIGRSALSWMLHGRLPLISVKLCVGYYFVVLLPGLLLELFFSFGLALEFEAGETETTT